MKTQSLSKLFILAGIASSVASTNAYELAVQVFSVDKKPLADAVVYAVPTEPQTYVNSIPTSAMKMAVMDQRNKAFIPHVLAVPIGTKVDFPNTDSVNHYVYSFSEIKKFQFKLFKGDAEKHQIVFDKPGIVALGCNIHDFMLGYIFVAPTLYVAVTDSTGQMHLVLPDKGDFTLEIWHERNNEDLTKLTQKLVTNAVSNNSASSNVQINFTKPLKPPRKMSHENDDY